MGYSLLLIVQRTHTRKCWLGDIAHYRWGNWFSQGLAQNYTGRWYPSRELGPRSSVLRPSIGPRLFSVTHRNPEHQRESLVLSCASVRHGGISPYCLQDPHPQPSQLLLPAASFPRLMPQHCPMNTCTSAARQQELQVSGLTWHQATLQPAVLSLIWALRDISWDKVAAIKFKSVEQSYISTWIKSTLLSLTLRTAYISKPLFPGTLLPITSFQTLHSSQIQLLI